MRLIVLLISQTSDMLMFSEIKQMHTHSFRPSGFPGFPLHVEAWLWVFALIQTQKHQASQVLPHQIQ